MRARGAQAWRQEVCRSAAGSRASQSSHLRPCRACAADRQRSLHHLAIDARIYNGTSVSSPPLLRYAVPATRFSSRWVAPHPLAPSAATGSDMSHDPRGVDVSLFEDPDDDYEQLQQIALDASRQEPKSLDKQQQSVAPAASVLLSRMILSATNPPAQAIPAASQLLYELRALDTDIGQAQSAYALAAYQSFALGRRDDALQWTALIPPAWTPGALQLIEVEKSSMSVHGLHLDQPVKRRYNSYALVGRILLLLVTRFPNDLTGLQQVVLLMARYGYIDSSTMDHFRRAVVHICINSTGTSADAETWAFWISLVDAFRSANADMTSSNMTNKRPDRLLKYTYNSVIRALVLKPRLPAAMKWASHSPTLSEVRSQDGDHITDIAAEHGFALQEFTYSALLEEVAKGVNCGDVSLDHELLRRIRRMEESEMLPTTLTLNKALVIAKLATELRRNQSESDMSLLNLDTALLSLVRNRQLDRARDLILQSLGREKVWSARVPSNRLQFGHLPSAAALGAFQEAVAQRYEVPMSSLVGLHAPHADGWYGPASGVTGRAAACAYVRHLCIRLDKARGGSFLWETALLQRCVQTSDNHEAVRVWCRTYPSNAGELHVEDMIQRALGPADSSAATALLERDAAARAFQLCNALKLNHVTSHAMSLILASIVSLAHGDYARLDDLYRTWLSRAFRLSESFSAPSSDSSVSDNARPAFELPYAQPLTYRPAQPLVTSSHFDAFIRAFASCTSTPSSTYGNSQSHGPPMRFGTRRAYQIIQHDMARHGVVPSIVSWTILLDALAREGHGPDGHAWERTRALARRLGMVPQEQNRAASLEFELDESTDVHRDAPPLPIANLATYTALLRGLLAARRHMWHETLEVRDWLLEAALRHESEDLGDDAAVDGSVEDLYADHDAEGSARIAESNSAEHRDTNRQRAPQRFTLEHVRSNARTQKVLQQVRELERRRTEEADEEERGQDDVSLKHLRGILKTKC